MLSHRLRHLSLPPCRKNEQLIAMLALPTDSFFDTCSFRGVFSRPCRKNEDLIAKLAVPAEGWWCQQRACL